MKDFDVIIVGAGPAGCAAAYDLCQRGRSVQLLDRHEFPRAKACGGGLTIKTLRALRYCVEPVVHRMFNGLRISLRHKNEMLLSGPAPICAMVDREEFDEFCLDQTLQAGAEFKTIGRLIAVDEMDDGVNVKTDAGTVTGQFLIGADGANSQVRNLTSQFHSSTNALALECHLQFAGPDLLDMMFDFGVVEHGYGWVFPKKDHLNVGLVTMHSEPGGLSPQTLKQYVDQKFPGASMTKVLGHRIGTGGWDYLPTSNRIFLVGDAAGLCEPLLAEGIHNAVVSGQVAAAAIEHSLESSVSALDHFRKLMKPICMDVRSCRRRARFFYQHPKLGYAMLTKPFFHRALMSGFAEGKTLSEIKRFVWL